MLSFPAHPNAEQLVAEAQLTDEIEGSQFALCGNGRGTCRADQRPLGWSVSTTAAGEMSGPSHDAGVLRVPTATHDAAWHETPASSTVSG